MLTAQRLWVKCAAVEYSNLGPHQMDSERHPFPTEGASAEHKLHLDQPNHRGRQKTVQLKDSSSNPKGVSARHDVEQASSTPTRFWDEKAKAKGARGV